ncbi:MAG: hypothetical protein FI672_02380 [SAR202 cluster bacterium]|nr:hypothetical protein [SAR202 cluster bacterium]
MEDSNEAQTVNFNVQDSNGQTILFESHPEKMVVYDAAAVEILLAMGEENKIIATHEFVELPENSSPIQRVGDAFNVNYEKVVELDPDLFFVFYDTFTKELADLGIKVLYLNSLDSDLEDIRAHIKIWGLITGNDEGVEDLIETFDNKLNTVIDSIPIVSTKPTVYYHTFDYWTPGGDTLIGNIFELLNTDMVSQNLSGYNQISLEEIVAKDPEYIFTDEWGIDQIKSEQALQSVSAIKNNQVYVLQNGSLSIASHNIVLAIEEISNIIYE